MMNHYDSNSAWQDCRERNILSAPVPNENIDVYPRHQRPASEGRKSALGTEYAYEVFGK